MNNTYRVVWNASQGLWQAVSELARASGGKGGRSRAARRARATAAALLPLGFTLPAWAAGIGATALPAGGVVTAGAGSLSQNGSTLTVNQTSQKLSLGWQSFNVGSQASVNFVQPNAQSVAVNRIGGTDGSVILGHLNANGQVYLINPNGILFGRGAQVNVGGLVASTLDVGDASIGTSAQTFSGSGTGSVVNRGTITAARGGYVALIGNRVVNEGAIGAQLGSVALTGGSAVTLNFDADRLVNVQVNQSTLDNLAKNGELIVADGGRVWMTAGAKDSLLASAVNNTGTIRAQTVQNQNGQITLLAGLDAGTTTVGGTLDATAPDGGNGGFVETSGAHVSVANDARITTLSSLGLAGTWLVDPVDFTIAPTGGDITGAQLSSQLATNGTVALSSSQGTAAVDQSGTGSINVNDNVSWSAHTLSLTAADNVNINATLTASGTAGLVINTATANGSQSAVAGGALKMGLNGNGFMGQVNFTGTGNTLTINGTQYTIITSLGSAGDVSGTTLQGIAGNLSGHYALGANITASSTSSWNGGTGFTPIGGGSGRTPFSGGFEGLGHTITGLVINNQNATDLTIGVGLFGASSGVIENVGLSGGSVSSNGTSTNIGSLVGANYGTIVNVYSSAQVSASIGNSWVGGLVGCNGCDGFGDTDRQPNPSVTGNHRISGGTITNAYATGSVTGSGYATYVGGLVGANYGSIRQAYAAGAVSSSGGASYGEDIGGLVGLNGSTGTITDAYATGNVADGASFSGSSDYIGGLVGYNYNGTVLNTYATGRVSSSDGTDLLGGIAGNNSGGIVGGNYWNTSTTGLSVGIGGGTIAGTVGLSPSGMQTASNFSGWSIATSGGQRQTWRIYQGLSTPLLEGLLVPLTLTVSSSTPIVTYNGADQAVTAFNASIVSPNFANVTGVTVTPAKNVGTYSETLASSVYTTLQTYDLTTSGSGIVSLTIAPAPLTVTGTSVASKTYNGTTTATLTGGTLSGLFGTDSVTLTQAGAFASAHAGSGIAVTANDTISGSGASNYTVTQPTGLTGTINALQLTATLTNTGVTKTYDGTTAAPSGFTPTYSLTGFLSGDTGATLTDTGAAYNSAHVASATGVTVSGLALSGITGSNGSLASDYTLSASSANVAATISPFALTASAPTIGGTNTKVYDGTTAATGATLSGGSVSGALSGDILSLNTSGIALAYNSSHVAGASSIGASGSLGVNIASSTHGSQSTDYSVSLPAITSVAGTITPAPLTVSLTNTGVTKTYDGTTNAPSGFTPTYSISGLVSGDSATVSSSATPVYNSSHVASATTITQGGLSLAAVAGNGTDNSVLGDYMLSSTTASTSNGVASISPLALTASAPTIGGTTTKVYDGTTAATGATLSGGGVSGALSGDTLSLDSSGIALAYNSSHVAGASSIGASGSLGVNIASSTNGSQSSDYSVSLPAIASVPGTITPAMLLVTLTNTGVTKTYDGTANAPSGFTPTYSFTGFVSGDVGATLVHTSAAYDSAHVASATSVTVAGLALSSITGSNGSLASDYTLPVSSADVAATITPATLAASLSNTTNVSKTYDGTASAPSGFTPTYSISGLVSGDSATVSSSAAPVYNSSHVASATAITQGGLSLASVAGNGTDNSVLSDYTLVSTSAATGNGVASISPATLTATLTNTGVTKTYDGTTAAPSGFTPAYSFTGLASGDTSATLTDTGAAYNSAHVASATGVTVSGLALSGITGSNGSLASDYTLSASSANVAATITPAPLAVSLSNTTNVSKTYDGTANAPSGFTPTYSISGLVSGDSATVSSSATPVFNSSHVASATAITQGGVSLASVAGNGTDNSALSDYALSSATASTGTGVASISPATLTATLTNTGVTKTYDGTTAAPSGFTPTYSLTGLASGDTSATLTDTGAAYNSAQVASATGVSVSGLAIGGITGSNGSLAGDYTLSTSSANATATITPAPLTVTANNATSTYSGAAYSGGNGVTYSGFVNGETASALGGALTYGGTSQGAVNVGSYKITPGGLTNSNYNIAYVSGTLTINPVTVTVTVTVTGTVVEGKTYDGTTAATLAGGVLSGVAGSDANNVTLIQSGTFASANAGTNIPVTANDTLAGSAAGNYTLVQPTGLTGTIMPATLTYVATPVSSIYGRAANGLSGTVTGFVAGETLASATTGTLAWGTPATPSSSVGTYAVNGIGLSANNGNYVFAQAAGNATALTVNPAVLTVTGAKVAGKTYDGTTAATLTGGTLSGVVGTDSVTLTQAGTFASANAGTNIPVTANDMLSGSAAGNYVLLQPTGLMGTISPATLTYVANPAFAYAGQTPSNLGGTVTGFVNGQTLASATTGTLTWTTTAGKSSAPGSYAIDGSGLASGNYVFVQAAGNANALTLSPLSRPASATNVITGLQLSPLTGGGMNPMGRTDATSAMAAVRPLAQTGGGTNPTDQTDVTDTPAAQQTLAQTNGTGSTLGSHAFTPLPGMPADLFPPALQIVNGGVRMPDAVTQP